MCVCVYAHARALSSQEQSAALWVTGTNFSFVPELSHRSNHVEYKDFHPARVDCPARVVLFVSRVHLFDVSYINFAVISLMSVILKIYKLFWLLGAKMT